MYACFHRSLRAGAACLLAATAQASAAPGDWVAVNAATLDGLRGGFTTGTGLAVSFGIERLVSINGTVVSRTSFQLANVGGFDPEQVRQTGTTLSSVKLIRNGGDNMMLAGFSSDTLAGTVIQNTLNDQRIDSRTTINASVNSMALLKAMNFNGNVSDAIARAVVPH